MLLTDKDKNILKKFFLLESNEMAFKRVILDSVADSGLDLTVKQVNSIFSGVESIITEDEKDENEVEE